MVDTKLFLVLSGISVWLLANPTIAAPPEEEALSPPSPAPEATVAETIAPSIEAPVSLPAETVPSTPAFSTEATDLGNPIALATLPAVNEPISSQSGGQGSGGGEPSAQTSALESNFSESDRIESIVSESDRPDVEQSGSSAPAPRLYGETDPTSVSPIPEGDRLASLSDDDWIALLHNDPAPNPQSPSSQSPSSQSPSSQSPIPNPQSPTSQSPSSQSPNLQSPISQPPIPNPQSPIPNLPIPNLQSPIPNPQPPNPLSQLTSVSQLSDVQPTDWAFQALQSLVERYGVIAGYPDGTFRGDRALTRYEFAAGLNAALDAITQQIAVGIDSYATQDDLETLRRLQNDFATELATLRGRVDSLEARTAELAANQFSTTVRLNGEVVLGLATAGGGDPPGTGDANPVFTYLSQFQIAGSFNGRDALRLELVSGNFADRGFAEPDVLNTNMALLSYQADTQQQVELSSLEYRFAVGDRLVVTLKPVGFSLNSVLSSNSIFASSSQGSLSRFASFNPILRIGGLEAGVGFDWLLGDRARLQVAYGAGNANDSGNGLFSSNNRAFGVQLLARPFRDVTTGFSYVNAFASDGHLNTLTGSNNADTSGGFDERSTIHAIGGTFQWRVTPGIIFGTWGGVTVTDSLESDAGALSTTYLFSLGFPDTFGREGDLLGIMVGQPFRLRAGIQIQNEDEAAGMHYEVFYRFRVNDHVSITPGFFVVTNPGHIEGNHSIFVGAIRTTFSF